MADKSSKIQENWMEIQGEQPEEGCVILTSSDCSMRFNTELHWGFWADKTLENVSARH